MTASVLRALGLWWATHRRRLLEFWAIGIGVSIVVTLMSAFGFLEVPQAKAYDLLVKLGGIRHPADVVVVVIDDDAFEAIGQVQPISRAYLAKILHGLQRAGAGTVGVDIAFTAPTAQDAILAAAIREFVDERGVSRVVLNSMRPKTGPLADPDLARIVVSGAPDVPEDADGVLRRTAFLVPRGATAEPSLGVAVAMRHLGLDQARLTATLAAGFLPQIDGRGDLPRVRPGQLWRINYVGPAKSFLTIPAGVLVAIADGAGDPPADNPLRGRVAMIGATFADSRDFFNTPYGVIPGVEAHANVVHMILTRTFIYPSGWLIGLVFQIIVVVGAGVAMVSLSGWRATVVTLAGPLVVGVPASYLAFHRGGYWVDFMLPVLATKMFGTWVGRLEKRRVKDVFGRYVSPEVATRIFERAEPLTSGNRHVSILVSNLRGFTAMAEKMPPQAVAAHLNEYFDAMTKAVFAHRGMVNDFVGDAIVAIFGAPLDDPRHALHAVETAAAMQAALAGMNATWKGAGMPTLRMGIGIHSGEVFAGNIGGASRMKYTLVGYAVNVAAGVAGLNTEAASETLVTEATRAAVAEHVEVRDCGATLVKGRNEPVRIYELTAVHSTAALTGGKSR
ncbi:MAG: adenylate/guanylate cyclase domain-containing protein [Candidatus Rokubacteria bacterium]|nr:adenylate/guanylate cyclase domain-containing protein [Candidatus Rokubacteria bacterium]